MKVTHFGPGGFPWAHVTNFGGTTISIGSNSDTNPPLSSLNFVQRITANTSNTLLNPVVNFAAGSNIILTLDQGPFPAQAYPSNTIRIHSTASGGGSSSLTVEEVDGSPTDSAVTKIVFPNGTLGIASHVATYTPAGGSGGALVFLEAHTASASATLDFTTFISSTYDVYEISFVNIVNATTNVSWQMQMGTGGGPTYDTGSNYTYLMNYNGVGDVPSGAASTSATAINLANSVRNTTNWSVNGSIRLYNPQGSTYKFIEGATQAMAVSDGNMYIWTDSGAYRSTTAVTAVRFLFSSGNITSGTVRIYGVAKA